MAGEHSPADAEAGAPDARVTPNPRATARAFRGPELTVLDGTATLFRAYYGMGMDHDRRSRDGVAVGGVIGSIQLTLGYVRRHRPTHLAVVFDSGQDTFRNRIDPRYKANRGDPPPDLEPQFELAREAYAALGMATFGVLDFEADDIMATLARAGQAAGLAVRLVTPDKDLCQLVDDGPPPIRLEEPRSGALLDAAGVRARVGVGPERVVDFLALVGDSADNIAGVRGVGPKAASALLSSFGDLDGVFRNLERVRYVSVRGAKGLARKLAAGEAEARLARRLVALVDDVDIGTGPEDLSELTCWRGPLAAPADALFQRLDAHGLLRAFRAHHERQSA